MAIFTLSKELRALSVVEFVVLIATIFFNCSVKTEEDGEDSTPRPVSFFKKACDVVSTMLGFGIFIAFLVLLLRDLRVCNDALPNRSIYVAFAGIALTIATRVAAHNMPRVWPEQRANSDVEDDNAMEKEGKAGSRVFKRLSGALDCMGNCAVSDGARTFLSALLATVGAVVWVVAMLGISAMVVFFVVTTIKIAIPEKYETVCDANAGIARTIMVALPYLYVVPAALMFIYVLFIYVLGQKFSQVTAIKIAVLLAIIQGMAYAVAGVLTFILFVRFFKVWDGEDPMLYEYVAFAVGPPLFAVMQDLLG